MHKVLQMGAYNKNLGDNIALFNLRHRSNKICPGRMLDWHSLDLLTKCNPQEMSVKRLITLFGNISKKYDALVVGGAGLIEGGVWNTSSVGWKLPFNKDILRAIKIPIFVVGIGCNFFRGQPKLTRAGIKNLMVLVDQAELFSVRNDGSLQYLNEIVGDNDIIEISDPGGMFDASYEIPRKQAVSVGYFNAAWNTGKAIRISRNISDSDISGLLKIVKKNDLTILPHSPKSWTLLGHKHVKYAFSEKWFLKTLSREHELIVDKYSNADFVICMHGHGQYICHARNIPFITLATMDKMTDLSRNLNLMQYNVDTQEDQWLSKLKGLVLRLKQDKSFLDEWYESREKRITSLRKDFDCFVMQMINRI